MKAYFDMVIAPKARKLDILLKSDNVPGLKTRYVLREVEESPEIPVSVVIDGECNHADTDLEEVPASWNPSDSIWAEVCTHCGGIKEIR